MTVEHALARQPAVRLASRLTVAAVAAASSASSSSASCAARPACPGLSNLSATELTQLIANLTTGNDRLRDEIAELSEPGGEPRRRARARRDDRRPADRGPRPDPCLGRPHGGVRAGDRDHRPRPDRRRRRRGPAQRASQRRRRGDLRDERQGRRRASSSPARRARSRSSNSPIGDAFEIRAIGSPQILTGTLTRTGGVDRPDRRDVPGRAS